MLCAFDFFLFHSNASILFSLHSYHSAVSFSFTPLLSHTHRLPCQNQVFFSPAAVRSQFQFLLNLFSVLWRSTSCLSLSSVFKPPFLAYFSLQTPVSSHAIPLYPQSGTFGQSWSIANVLSLISLLMSLRSLFICLSVSIPVKLLYLLLLSLLGSIYRLRLHPTLPFHH